MPHRDYPLPLDEQSVIIIFGGLALAFVIFAIDRELWREWWLDPIHGKRRKINWSAMRGLWARNKRHGTLPKDGI